jgi:hypothetical protein
MVALQPAMAALLREEVGASPDILAKFSKVAASIEDNRTRENARENIRKKLAMEAGREKQDSCDLQICFMNEIASEDENSETGDDCTAGEAIVRANISHKAGQIIVPMEGRLPAGPAPAPRPSRREEFQLQVWHLARQQLSVNS